MKIVIFKNNKYAIRRYNIALLRYEYLSLLSKSSCWLPKTSSLFEEGCLGSLPQVRNKLIEVKDFGTPINDKNTKS